MRFMRMVVALAVVVFCCFCIEASDRKSKRVCQGECAVAVAKAQLTHGQDAATEKKEPAAKATPVETIIPSNQANTSSGSCASGSCSTSTTRFSRRGR